MTTLQKVSNSYSSAPLSWLIADAHVESVDIQEFLKSIGVEDLQIPLHQVARYYSVGYAIKLMPEELVNTREKCKAFALFLLNHLNYAIPTMYSFKEVEGAVQLMNGEKEANMGNILEYYVAAFLDDLNEFDHGVSIAYEFYRNMESCADKKRAFSGVVSNWLERNGC